MLDTLFESSPNENPFIAYSLLHLLAILVFFLGIISFVYVSKTVK